MIYRLNLKLRAQQAKRNECNLKDWEQPKFIYLYLYLMKKFIALKVQTKLQA